MRYTKYMTKFATVTPSPNMKSQSVRYVALAYAAVLVVMAVAQLFKFEEFVPILASFGLGGGERTAQILASVLVVAEVFALPYLLRIYVSPLFRIVSMLLGWLVVLLWAYLILTVLGSVNAVTDAGFLGTAIEVPFGWWNIIIVFLMALLMAIATWGMSPELPGRKSVSK